ncbi:hypothetical protein [Peribacillus sp. SCS-155]|uniref:hypothetical protein n=1 Tax=Peribacillus sedimenti TaxID=3115297 RepID=UPI003906BADF
MEGKLWDIGIAAAVMITKKITTVTTNTKIVMSAERKENVQTRDVIAPSVDLGMESTTRTAAMATNMITIIQMITRKKIMETTDEIKEEDMAIEDMVTTIMATNGITERTNMREITKIMKKTGEIAAGEAGTGSGKWLVVSPGVFKQCIHVLLS